MVDIFVKTYLAISGQFIIPFWGDQRAEALLLVERPPNSPFRPFFSPRQATKLPSEASKPGRASGRSKDVAAGGSFPRKMAVVVDLEDDPASENWVV